MLPVQSQRDARHGRFTAEASREAFPDTAGSSIMGAKSGESRQTYCSSLSHSARTRCQDTRISSFRSSLPVELLQRTLGF